MPTNCFSFAPRDSVPGLIAKICKYLKNHPGWSDEELEDEIRRIIGETSVESFNGRTGAVVLNEEDVNNLKIASAYFAEGDESIDELDVVALYNQGVRFVFTNWNSVTSGYDLAFVLDYFSGSNNVVYYPMSTGSGGGGNIVSVNGKTGIVELSLSDILGDSGAQVKLCTATEFTSNTLETWNAYYDDGYRIIGVVNSGATAIDYIYLLKQDENNHQPIGLSAGASDAYTPDNPPPYPVTKVNNKTGNVTINSVDGLESSGSYRGGSSSASYPWYQYDYNIDFFKARGYTGATYGKVTESDVCLIPHTLRVLKSTVGAAESRNSTYKHGIRFTANGLEEVVFKKGNPYNGSVTTAIIPGQMVIDKSGQVYSSINPPPYPVTSVNGLTGDVTLPESSSGVSSVNGKTGAVTGVYDTENPPPYPVTSVNGKTGAVTGLYDSDSPPPYPVNSVNGQTGAVVIDRLHSSNSSASLRQINADAEHTRMFYSQSTFDGVTSTITGYIDPSDNTIHIGLRVGDGSWYDQELFTSKNPPPSSSSLSHTLVTTETVGESNNRHIVYYSQLPGIFNESIDSIISVMPVTQGAFYLRPKYYSDDAFELKVYGDLTDIDYQIDVQIIYEV